MRRSDEEPQRVGDDEPDKSNQPCQGDRRAREERGRREDRPSRLLGVDAKGRCSLLPERVGIDPVRYQ